MAIGSYLPQFEHVGIKLGDDESRIEGKLHTNSDVDQVTDGLTKLFGSDKNAIIDISTTELTHEDGTKRKNPLTGKEEVYDRGYWLPVVTFSSELLEWQTAVNRDPRCGKDHIPARTISARYAG